MKRSEEFVVRTYIGYVEIFCHAKCSMQNVTMQNVAVFQKKKLENHNILHGNILHGKKFLRNLC